MIVFSAGTDRYFVFQAVLQPSYKWWVVSLTNSIWSFLICNSSLNHSRRTENRVPGYTNLLVTPKLLRVTLDTECENIWKLVIQRKVLEWAGPGRKGMEN